jgi:GH43 family beta-xylosidase
MFSPLRSLLCAMTAIGILSSLSFVNAFAADSATSWTNPIVPQRADPHVILHTDGYYYLTATVPEYDRIELRRARTLAGLSNAEPKVIWRKHASGPMGAHIWAPELHFIDKKWYLYFTAGEAENIWAIRPYVLEGAGENPLEAVWTEKGKIKLGWDSFSLDATTFVHRGVRYYVWAQDEKGIKGSNIYIARMDTPLSITGPVTRLTQPEYAWEKRIHWVCEAPAVLVKNGRAWMTYSASATGATYCLGLLSADANANLLDASVWKKSSEPVFASSASASQFGPGHNSFTTTPDGKTDILVYHARNYERIQGSPLRNPDRATRAQIINWHPDGSPDFGQPVPDGPYPPAALHTGTP